MLSDFRDDDSNYGISLTYSDSESGDSSYHTYSLGLRYKPLDWLQFTGSIPYTNIDGEEVIWDQPLPGVNRRNEFSYSNDGLGDITVMGWVDLAYFFLNPGSESSGDTAVSEEARDPLPETGDPMLFFGAGAKLATGIYNEWDWDKLAFDRSKNLTGEYDVSEGMLPARFQLGTGTTDILVALFYQQRFGRWQPSAGLSYQFSGGENDIGYERSDRISWTVGTKFHLMQRPDCKQFYLYGGISGADVTSHDYDHSEDTTQLGSQAKGKVAGTRGTYNFYNLGVGYDITKNVTVSGGLTLPLDSQDDDSEYSFDRTISLTLQMRF